MRKKKKRIKRKKREKVKVPAHWSKGFDSHKQKLKWRKNHE